MPTENHIYCPALHKRSKSYPFSERVPRSVRMFTTVVADPMPFIGFSLVKDVRGGAMTGIADFNYPAFNVVADQLRPMGYEVENPADHGVVDGAQ